jgi:spore coat protein U-like protein
LQNPVSNATGTIATELTLDATYTIELSTGTGTFSLDEDIIGSVSGKSAKVVSANVYQGNTTLRCIIPYNYNNYTELGRNFIVNETITGKTSSATGTFIKMTLPEVVKNTGKVLYVENRKKITRNYDQAENIHMVIEF